MTKLPYEKYHYREVSICIINTAKRIQPYMPQNNIDAMSA